MGGRNDGKGGLAHREGVREDHWYRQVGAARSATDLCSALHREASWSRSNFFWGTFRFKRRSVTLAANSGFDQQSMIALASRRILELGATVMEELPTIRPQRIHAETNRLP